MEQEQINWTRVSTGEEYYVATTGYLGNNERAMIVVRSIDLFDDGSAMIYSDNGRGYAVGGIFEGPIGPKNRFWPVSPSDIIASLSASVSFP